MIERWIEAFEMELGDDGVWRWKAEFAEGDVWFRKYQELLRKWNKLVPEYNATINPQPVGRPLAASEAQEVQVRRLRKSGASLRAIVDETGLGLQTVRTIVGRDALSDRTTMRRLERIDPDRAAVISGRRVSGLAMP
jgi:hypothetical protein